ncbi:hypothetical protein A11S_1461 [Micavibrio aeruginosavorus EPB]|uniref:Uncharacterized protein n=1 Tax=Micavibrio aeruginosavorus EPB TaxID=349215 RepID=M4VIF1_9BACT|nr:hypothetical protein A11S_1461 [Micavibrio aeruginosavorus EPB]
MSSLSWSDFVRGFKFHDHFFIHYKIGDIFSNVLTFVKYRDVFLLLYF